MGHLRDQRGRLPQVPLVPVHGSAELHFRGRLYLPRHFQKAAQARVLQKKRVGLYFIGPDHHNFPAHYFQLGRVQLPHRTRIDHRAHQHDQSVGAAFGDEAVPVVFLFL